MIICDVCGKRRDVVSVDIKIPRFAGVAEDCVIRADYCEACRKELTVILGQFTRKLEQPMVGGIGYPR